MYEIFQKIDDHSHLSQMMYEGSCCQKFIQLSPIVVEESYYEIWTGWCIYMVPKWEIRKKIHTTVADCILSKKKETLIQ